MNLKLTELNWLRPLREGVGRHTPGHASGKRAIRHTIICFMAGAIRQMDLTPVAAWKPPKSTRDCIDLVGVTPGSHPPEVKLAVVADPLVELPKLRTLEWVDCPDKLVITFSERADKVQADHLFPQAGIDPSGYPRMTRPRVHRSAVKKSCPSCPRDGGRDAGLAAFSVINFFNAPPAP